MSRLTYITLPAIVCTETIEIGDLQIDGRWVWAKFLVDITHTPAQQARASLCYYDSPPDGPETTVDAIAVVGWVEIDQHGNEQPSRLSGRQIVAAAAGLIQAAAEDLFT